MAGAEPPIRPEAPLPRPEPTPRPEAPRPEPPRPEAIPPRPAPPIPRAEAPRPAPPASPPPAPSAPAPPPAEARPEPLPRTWARVVASMPAVDRAVVEQAMLLGFDRGSLRVGVRKEMWRLQVYDVLKKVDLSAFFPGFTRIDVALVAEGGATGRERRVAAEEQARVEARAKAEQSPVVRRLLEVLKGELEGADPVGEIRDTDALDEDMSDE